MEKIQGLYSLAPDSLRRINNETQRSVKVKKIVSQELAGIQTEMSRTRVG